ncbi:hypothetical protein BSKO_04149 [Bryopsis sp. KO-2023]|nr:hypothetical protein BSKO_04149 [Bryopsis sp. KO-2023]
MAGATQKANPRRDLGLALVPVRLDVRVQGRHVREAFCVEPSVEEIYIAHLTKQFCSEAKLPKSCEQLLFVLIKDQIDKFQECMPQMQISEGSERTEIIKLNFNIGKTHVEDQFLWNVEDPDADPEAFAAVMCEDLKLPRTFMPEIACRIREQIVEYRKKGSPGLATSPDRIPTSQSSSDLVKRRERVPGRKSIYNSVVVRKRSSWEEWGPKIRELTDSEIKQMENQAKRPRLQSGHGAGSSATGASNRSASKGEPGSTPNPTASKRQQQRNKASRSKKDTNPPQAPPVAETLANTTISPPVGMIPVVPSLPIQQQPPPPVESSLMHNAGPMSMYNAALQQTLPNPIGTPWSSQQQPIGRIPTAGGGSSNALVEQYMQLHTMHNQPQPNRPEVVMGNGMGAQSDGGILQGNLGNMVGQPYHNGGMMTHYQNSQTQIPTRIHWGGW